jgi:glycosyltransferase involved in cell wall biosynthesis
MKILLISHFLDYSGAPIALLQLAKSLVKFGHSVSIAALQDGPLGVDFIQAGIKSHMQSNAAADYDLVIANTVVSIPAALQFTGSTQKILAWIHETEYFFESNAIPAQNLLPRDLRFAAFVSKFQINQYEKWLPNTKKIQLKNCVEISPNIIPYHQSAPYLVFSGPWTPRKAQYKLIQLLQTLEHIPEIHFIGADRPDGISGDKFIFTGPLRPEDAKSRIAGSSGLISCSMDEAQPLVAVEAALMRVPVMLSQIPAHRELKRYLNDILLFDPEDAMSFKLALHVLGVQLQDKNLLDRMKEDAVLAFNIDEFDKNVLDLMNFLDLELKK